MSDNRKPPQCEMDWGVFCSFRALGQHIGPRVSFSEAILDKVDFLDPEGLKLATRQNFRKRAHRYGSENVFWAQEFF